MFRKIIVFMLCFIMPLYFVIFVIATMAQTKSLGIEDNVKIGKVKSWKIPSEKTSNNDIKIFYNKIPKCGSRSLESTIKKLAHKNDFYVHISSINRDLRLQEEDEVLKVIDLFHSQPTPFVYSRHVYFIDFSVFESPQPVYINLVRDPVDRFVSNYYFKRFGDVRKTGARANFSHRDLHMDINDCILRNGTYCNQVYSTLVRFFCGHESFCSTATSKSMAHAKKNIERFYVVVGYLEDYKGMLKVLEKLLPAFFKGAQKSIKNKKTSKTATLNKTAITEEARAMLKRRLRFDCELYDFIRARFNKLKKKLKIT